MYVSTPIHKHTHKTFFYTVRKFYFDKKKARNYQSKRGSSVTRRSCV